MTAGNWSVPETEVMDAIDEAVEEPRAVLATVVGVEGNAYRRPGAKMVIADEGEGVGSITAGCLEDEVLALAEDVIADGRPRLETFDLTGEDDVWGLGVGCNGVIDILLEPLDASYQPVVDAYEDGQNVAVLTVLDGASTDTEQGDRMYGQPAGGALTLDGPDWPDWLVDALEGPTAELVETDTSDTLAFDHGGETVRVFVDSVTAPPELVIFGTGHDVAPVADLASQVDFRVTVAGFRGATATEERFPEADRVISTSPADVREALDLDGDTYAVIMTHNFIDDRLALEELLESPVPYVGLLGPRERFEEIREECNAAGREFTEAELERVYTPAGLDLGGGTPFHIAQSIAAEVTAVRFDRTPKHLRDRGGHIHERPSIEQ